MITRRSANRHRLALVVTLAFACVFFIGATATVFNRQMEQKSLLTETIRASGWTAYQAQLEYIKSLSILDLAIADPSHDRLDEISVRLEILLSRVPLITQSDEGDFLRSLPGVPEMVESFEREITLILDEVYAASERDQNNGVAHLTEWRDKLTPFGAQLQSMLQQSVAYNERLYKRENDLQNSAALLPLSLLVGSGSLLVLMLIFQVSRAERNLELMHRAQLEAAESEASLRRIVEAAPVAFFVADPYTDCVVYINESAAKLLEADLGSPLWRGYVGQCRRIVDLRSAHASDSRDTFAPVNLRHISGALLGCNVMRSRVVWNGREQHLYALVETSRNRNAEREALQASTLIAIGEMAASIVHEINQPLATMKMASSNALALIRDGSELEKIGAKLIRIDGQIDRARRITEQIRRLVRPQQAERPKTLFSVREATELAATSVSDEFNRANISLSLSLDISDRVLVAGDQVLFEQALINLLMNARHAFEKREHEKKNTAPAAVRIETAIFGTKLQVRICDNAGGLAPEVLDNLFRAFITTKDPGKGTGLGLSLTRKIVIDMGGTIEGANVGDGAQFTIEVPIREQISSAAA